jgi:hypothetical protein
MHYSKIVLVQVVIIPCSSQQTVFRAAACVGVMKGSTLGFAELQLRLFDFYLKNGIIAVHRIT